MAADLVLITTSGNFRAQRLSRFLGLLREARHAGEDVKDLLDHMAADPVYTGVEGAGGVGIPTGQGQTVYNLVSGAYARINHVDVDALIDRVTE